MKKPSISSFEINVGARASRLSQAQVSEVAAAFPDIVFQPIYVETTGDKDQQTSLRFLDKTDFFTREIDNMLRAGLCRIAIHSAKDLPEPIPEGLSLVALTEGVDPADVLVFNEPLPFGARIGTSCERRERAVKQFRGDLVCVDIRGTIEKRLSLLDEKKIDGLVVAEAALIRLGLTDRKRVRLKGEVASLQGKLAVLARSDDTEMAELFARLDIRQKKVLYLGLDPSHYQGWGKVTHCPLIQVIPRQGIEMDIAPFTHIIFTSKSAVQAFPHEVGERIVIAIGQVTAAHLQAKGWPPHYIAKEETQEGIIALLEQLDLKESFLLLPRSSRARPVLTDYLEAQGIAYRAVDLYDTCDTGCSMPDLHYFDEIIFTSPSTVDVFFRAVDKVPPHVKLHAIGPVTSNALEIMMLKSVREQEHLHGEMNYERVF